MCNPPINHPPKLDTIIKVTGWHSTMKHDVPTMINPITNCSIGFFDSILNMKFLFLVSVIIHRFKRWRPNPMGEGSTSVFAISRKRWETGTIHRGADQKPSGVVLCLDRHRASLRRSFSFPYTQGWFTVLVVRFKIFFYNIPYIFI